MTDFDRIWEIFIGSFSLFKNDAFHYLMYNVSHTFDNLDDEMGFIILECCFEIV